MAQKFDKYLLILSQKFGLFRLNTFGYPFLFDMITRNGGLSLVGIILRLFPTMKGGLTPSVLLSIKIMLNRMSLIANCQGKIGFVKYFKQVSVITQKVLGGDKTLTTTPRVKTTKSGIPCFFPSYIRKALRSGQTWSMRLSLTIVSLYRDVIYDSKVNTDSITNPFNGNEKTVKEVINFIPSFVNRFIPLHLRGRTLLVGKMRIFPILTSSPQTAIKDWNEDSSSPLSISSTSIISLMRSAATMPQHYLEYFKVLYEVVGVNRWNSSFNLFTAIRYGANNNYFHLFERICYSLGVNPGSITDWGLRPRIEYAKKWSNWILFKQDLFISILEYCMKWSRFYLRGPLRPTKYIGKLGLKQEAAGKMRVFAMMDPWTQWIMYPFHKALFSILDRRRDVDGTFNQLGPISRKEGKPSFSMDLSSATDRLPMSIQTPLIKEIFNLSDQQANAWTSLLIERSYKVPNEHTAVQYAVGQPMGALSSWAMLAMTHHLIVQFAAFQVYRENLKGYFSDYAVLGDDIVIFDTKVSKRYHSVILSLGVECNLSKSISSPSGDALEFAKRTFYKGENVSPSPLKEYFMSLNSVIAFVEYVKKYNLTIPQALRVAGFGYKVISGYQKPFHKLNIKVRYLILLLGLTSTSFRKSLGQSLSSGHNLFLVGFSTFLEDYCNDLLERITKLENISKSYDLDSFISQPRWFIKKWVDHLGVPIGTSKAIPFSWFGNPLKKLGKTWFYKVDGPIWIIRELNYKMVYSILLICSRVKSTIPNILDTAKLTKLEILTGSLDPNSKKLDKLVLSLFDLLTLEAELAQRSLTDLCLRPSLKIPKRPGEPKLFRIHSGLNKILKSMKKSKFFRFSN